MLYENTLEPAEIAYKHNLPLSKPKVKRFYELELSAEMDRNTLIHHAERRGEKAGEKRGIEKGRTEMQAEYKKTVKDLTAQGFSSDEILQKLCSETPDH